MRKLSRRIGAKAAAWLLLAVSLIALTGGTAGTVLLAFSGAFTDGGAYFRRAMMEQYAYRLGNRAVYDYYQTVRDDPTQESFYQNMFSMENMNFAFTLTDEDGEVLLTNGTAEAAYAETVPCSLRMGEPAPVDRSFPTESAMHEWLDEQPEDSVVLNFVEYRWKYVLWLDDLRLDGEPVDSVTVGETQYQVGKCVLFDSEEERDIWLHVLSQRGYEYEVTADQQIESVVMHAVQYDTQRLTLTAKIPAELTARDQLYYELTAWNTLVMNRVGAIILLAVGAVLTLALIVFLCCGAGWHPDELRLTWFDRIPLEFLLAVAVTVVGIPVALFGYGSSLTEFAAGLLILPLAALWAVLTLVSFAARVKVGQWWHGTIVWQLLRLCLRVLKWCWKVCGKVWHWLGELLRGIPLIWQLALGWLLLCVVELIILAMSDAPVGWWFIEKLILTPILLIAGIQLTKLRQAARRIADGDLQTQVDLTHMYGAIRSHGEDLNHITAGLQTAVEQRTRSERMKTELITNVSHDIKTPLTSIVNYVDLLSQEQMPSETARNYLEVLQRQSARLRKLTEDLIEASKAATGNVDVHSERMDVNVLLTQTAGEYEEKLRAQELEPVLTLDEEPADLIADGRLLWRVFDNLLSNICKYAMPGTRVYLSAHRTEDNIEIVFRNISRTALNLSGEELMERFVRGDASRSTEGSGLGLSIARSLTELMGGAFLLTVDGDLFKVTMRFTAASDE